MIGTQSHVPNGGAKINQTKSKSDYLSSSFSQHEKKSSLRLKFYHVFTDLFGPQNNLESHPPKSTQIGPSHPSQS